MKIGILEAGLLREEMATRFDPYPIMFERFLGLSGHTFEFQAFSVLCGEMPVSIYDCDGWLITGSRHGVYENLEWMVPLQDFIRELANTELPLIGVCFGHQIIAQALGGEVIKSDKGWGVGLHQYGIDQIHSWMGDESQSVGIYAFHQDQVVTCPKSAKVFSSSEFCPFAGLSYGDSMISVQAHPEFEESYETALLETYVGTVVPEDVTEAALQSMYGNSADTQILASWFAEFFMSRQSRLQSVQSRQA
ncbi:MAG: type 1 glutamine amidotransferase [Gammaproteobacteria bacterium]|nr:type 1 glutamine amidotransferase [Gammaproteobacteria bacterium]